MKSTDTLAFGYKAAGMLLERYCEDFKPEEYLFRFVPHANCVAWTLGHLVLSSRKLLASFGVSDIPALPEDFEKRFGREDSAPSAADFGDVSILLPLFSEFNHRVVAEIKKLSDDQLSKPVEKPFAMVKTVDEKLQFYALHIAQHVGQITMIRRALGRPVLI